MAYAEVCVNSPIAQRRTFSYAIPSGLSVEVGQAVWVPFGEKILQGVVLELTDSPAVEETRDIAGIIETSPVLSPAHVSLSRWISQHYLSPLFDAVALMLPPGFERKPVTLVSVNTLPDDFDFASLTTEQAEALSLVQAQDKVSLRQLERTLGKKKAASVVSQMVRRGLFTRIYEMEAVKANPKIELCLSLAIGIAEAQQEVARLREKRAVKQALLLDFLMQQSHPVPLSEVKEKIKCDRAVANALVAKGLATIQKIELRRDPLSRQRLISSLPPVLTPAQESACESVQITLQSDKGGVFLLHGVTGSGKTEVYLQCLTEVVRRGKKGIVLVPEISLTPQTIERFASRFPGRVAVLHSQLSLGEQFDEWRRIRDGEFDVVIGPRSALFAPQPDLSLIVVDEEHEWNYKQHDQAPLYHARDAAIKLAELTGAAVVLGSATPDIETYYHVQQGDYQLLQLPERVSAEGVLPLPEVRVVDLREELKAGNRSLFSRALTEATAKALDAGEQVILFLNRRGASTFVQCRKCGFALRCRRCDLPLTYHMAEELLVCHQCNYKIRVPAVCPRCDSPRIKFLGAGTQKLEQEAGLAFPQARLLRWDSDTTRQKDSHQAILDKFRAHQADILIGTQMVSKGLDLPQVTLVGVVNADTGLNLPDFRAGERTFQLLSQVAGRAGRGPLGGQVIIQTYSPEHYAIQAAAKHDYSIFYEREIGFRRQLHNPPFSRLASLIYTHTNEARCRKEAERVRQRLNEEKDAKGIPGITLIGPAPAFIHRLRGRFRWQIIIRAPDPTAFLSPIPLPQGWTVDIDPVGLS